MATVVQVSRRTEHALAALVELAKAGPGACLSADRLAVRAGLPRKFTANILSDVVKQNLVTSRCAGGGYCLIGNPRDLTVLAVIRAMEGPFDKPECFLDRARRCDPAHPCALHEPWMDLRRLVEDRLSKLTIQDLADHPSPGTFGELDVLNK